MLKRVNLAFEYGLLLSLLVAGEALSAAYWIFFPYLSVLTTFAQADAIVVDALSPFSPALLLMLLYSWIGMLLYKHSNRFSRRLRAFLGPVSSSVKSLFTHSVSGKGLRLLNHPRTLAFIGILGALFLSVIPYRPDLNPNGIPVGIDFHYYIEWIGPMLEKSPGGALYYAMGVASGGSRPLLLIPVYLAVSTGTVSLVHAVEALPAILGPLLVLSIFFFVSETFGDEKLAGIAALATPFSFYVTVGIWAGYYANMLALSVGFAFLTLLFRYWKKQTIVGLFWLILSSIGLLLAHPWTWVIVLTATATFAATTWWAVRKPMIVKTVGLVLVVDLLIDIAKSLVFGASVSVQEASGSFITGLVPTPTIDFWPNIVSGLFGAYDGLLANTLILVLSLIAIISFRPDSLARRFLLVWVAVSSIPILVLSDLAQTRIFYNLPFPIFTALGLLLVQRVKGLGLHSNLVFSVIVLALANYALRSVTSLGAIPSP
ncbi:MAG: hypothetical protein AUJ07_10420 [Crenarchaeota archaeon 13_1_40CM_3_53_5]|nr:MAG: hypothetical protein AUJ07_10420 [Crenarchaeota archaeon 13_1_40CM_3_53_5]